MPTSAWPGDSEPTTSAPSALLLDAGDEVAHDRQRDVGLEQRHAHLAQHVLHVVFGDAGLAAHRLDEAAEAVGEGGGHGGAPAAMAGPGAKVHCRDDSIVRCRDAKALRRPLAMGAAEPGRAGRLRCAATWPGERYAAGLRIALLIGWVAHAVAIVVDIAGFGMRTSGRALRLRAGAVGDACGSCSAVYIIESRFVPLPGVRRRLALIGADRVVLAWLLSRASCTRSSASRWAPLHWVLGIASYGLFGAAVLHAAMLEPRRAADAQLPARSALGAPACRCCGSSG